MKKVCMLLVLRTYVYHDARVRNHKVHIVGEYQYFTFMSLCIVNVFF